MNALDFTIEARRTFAVPRPEQLASDMILSPFFTFAMHDTSLCLAILACSSAIMSIYSAGKVQSSITLRYTVLAIQELRTQLERRPFISELHIVAMIFLCALSIYSEDLVALKQHYRGLKESIRRSGGVKCLKLDGAAVIAQWMENYCSLIFFEAPQFGCPSPPKDLQQQITQVCGEAWIGILDLNAEVLENCQDTSFMTNVLSHVHTQGSTMSCYVYLLRSTAYLSYRRATLISKFSKSATVSEVVLYAIQVLVFLMFYGSEKHSLVFKIYPRVIVLQSNGQPRRLCEYGPDLRIWPLAASCLAPIDFREKYIALLQLRVELSSRFGSEEWPDCWQRQFEQILIKFLWCKESMDIYFSTLCSVIKSDLSLAYQTSRGSSSTIGNIKKES